MREAADLEQQAHDARHAAKAPAFGNERNLVDEVGKTHQSQVLRTFDAPVLARRDASSPTPLNRQLNGGSSGDRDRSGFVSTLGKTLATTNVFFWRLVNSALTSVGKDS
jgi:hypothetical protein